MHFSIPDTQEFTDTSGNSYLGYNIHINGLFHCTVRYRQLHHLHEHLTKESPHPLPQFPPKKLFPLTLSQQEERRLCLEKYIQSLGQSSVLNSCPLLNSFLLNAQQETSERLNILEDLEIHLQNGPAISLKASTSENSSRVLKKVCRHLNLPEEYDNYFALFITIDGDDTTNIVRKLQDFESPILTQLNLNYQGIKLIIGKNYWNSANDLILMENSVALSLLYHQASAEIGRGWILVPEELQEPLESCKNGGNMLEYLEIARKCKYYGFIQFSPCYCDYPKPGTKVIVAIGNNELNLRIIDADEHEAIFKVTRMRCWRITTLHNGIDKTFGNDYTLELSFEYLIGKNQLQWITVTSEQAILMSVSLQSMIDELIVKDHVGKRREEGKMRSWSYLMRDGGRIVVGEEVAEGKEREKDAGKKVEKLRKVHCDIMENNAFHMIGDDDL